jgi:hypothetical protein
MYVYNFLGQILIYILLFYHVATKEADFRPIVVCYAKSET